MPYAVGLLSIFGLTVCLSCLSVTLVHCGQTVGWIRMPFGIEVGLGPGHIVLDGDPASPSKKEYSLPISGPCLLWPNSWMDRDATWYTGRPWLWQHCVRRESSSPTERGTTAPPLFGPCLLWSNGWMDQDTTWYGGRPRPRRHC